MRRDNLSETTMSINRYHATFITAFGLMCLCSCATRELVELALPGETSFNEEAGRGHDDYLRVKLHLEGGKEFECRVDTGSPYTILKKELEPELGERVGTNIVKWVQRLETNGVYRAPKLFVGNTPLRTDDVVYTGDEATLGMDILRHYCIQLDFTSNKMRFLSPKRLDAKDLGEVFPLTITADNHVLVHVHFLGLRRWVVDTANPFDAALPAQKFDRVLRGQQFVPIAVGTDDKMPYSGACLPRAVFGGFTCTDLYVSDFLVGDLPPGIGLPFLARYLVTLNFPKRVMYLKQVAVGSPILGALLTEEAKTFLKSMAEKGELPGWSKNKDKIDWKTDSEDSGTYPAARIFRIQTGGQADATSKNTYQYSVVRETQDSLWKLQRAWRSDTNGRVVEDYLTP